MNNLTKSRKLKKLFWEPLTLAIMNTAIDKASAKILSNVLKKTIFLGKRKCYIYQPIKNWHNTIIQPALDYIQISNRITFRKRLKEVVVEDGFIKKLLFNDGNINIRKTDNVISAVSLNSFSKIFFAT